MISRWDFVSAVLRFWKGGSPDGNDSYDFQQRGTDLRLSAAAFAEAIEAVLTWRASQPGSPSKEIVQAGLRTSQGR